MGKVVAERLPFADDQSMNVSHDDPRSRVRRLFVAAAGAALALSGCASETAQTHYNHGKEHFAQGKYGRASPKVVADGEPVPRGGGQYLVGRPYHVAGHTYVPAENPGYSAVGMASWYGAAFHGRRTSNGEIYDMASITAAHPTMPLPSYARVTNLENGYSLIVRVNDRGPFHGGRVMDVSSRAADVLGFKGAGTAKIKVEYVGRAPMEGSDDSALLASLRTDGAPATLNGYSAPGETMVADAGSSLFGAFFSGRGSAAPPAPPPPPAPAPARPLRAPAPEPAPQSEPEPVQVAAAEPAPAPPRPVSVDDSDVAPEKPARPLRQPRGPIPLPPSRPFDLGQIRPTPLVVVAEERPPRPPAKIPSVLPPRKPVLQASAEKALY